MSELGFRVATFDCYGTLIDWEGGAGSFLYSLALRNQDPNLEPGQALRDRWEAIQWEVKEAEYRPYKEILVESLRRWVDERGYAWNPEDGDAFVRAIRSWQPFPDTRPVLRQAREAGLTLAIISNTDRDILAHTLRHLDVPIDIVVTAEDCRAYKPSLVPFEQALGRLGEDPATIVHVAFGFKYDIGPARRLGMRTAWVNRHVEAPPSDEHPDYVWRDLWGLADLVGGRDPRNRRRPGQRAMSAVHGDSGARSSCA